MGKPMPVSGGEPKAIDGTLSVMVGGDHVTFERVEPVLEAMAASVVHVGEIGAGNIAKLANQVIVAVNIAAVSEALVLAQAAGVDPGSVLDAILHIKDLDNALDTSREVDVPLPLANAVLTMMRRLAADGHEAEDHSALARYYETLSGTEFGEQAPG